MQELRLVAVSEDGSYAVLVVPGRGGRFSLQIDDRLRAVARGQFSRLAQYEIEVESPLRPKEIQERIRAGETADEIADAAGVPIERVRWFEGPVLAERAYKAQEAQAAMVRRPGDSGPGPRLGEVVTERLTALGTSAEDAHWDSIKRTDGNWQVQLLYSASGRAKTAEWVYDPRRKHATPDGDEAARLSLPEADLPPELDEGRAEATVTPLQPRFASQGGSPVRQARRVAEPPPRPHAQPAPLERRVDRVEQPERVERRQERAEHEERRPERVEHAQERAERPQRVERAEERPERAERAERAAAAEAAPHPSSRGRMAQKPRRQAVPAPEVAPERTPEPPRAPAAERAEHQERVQQPTPEESAAAAEAERAPAAQGGRRAANGRGRRSSVPSWDEIMFGSSRPRD
jgi:hypothetical protein